MRFLDGLLTARSHLAFLLGLASAVGVATCVSDRTPASTGCASGRGPGCFVLPANSCATTRSLCTEDLEMARIA